MRELIYYSTRLVDEYWMIRAGRQLHRRVGRWRFLSMKPRVSIGLPAAQMTLEPRSSGNVADIQYRYDKLRRALRRDLLSFPNDTIPSTGHPPAIEFTVDARWGLMPFLGVGATGHIPVIDGQGKLCLWTFWLEGTTADGSILILIGSADNLLSVDANSFGDLDVLRPGFNYPSTTCGLTALVKAVSPRLETHVPDDEWADMRSDEVDVVVFALDVSRIAEEDEYDDEEYDSFDDLDVEDVDLNRWVLRSGTVHGLARVYASAVGRDVKYAGSLRFDWLPDDAKVIVGAPYALYVEPSRDDRAGR